MMNTASVFDSDPIPLVQVSGTHRQVGQHIGETMRPQIQRTMAHMRDSLPPGVTWDDMLHKGRLCLVSSRAVYPHFVEELEGVAQGAGVPFEELFLETCEELWEATAWRSRMKGCTDFAARGHATVDGATLLAHTNDLSPQAERDLVILRIQTGDEPQLLAVSPGGLGFSAGFNAAGISVTGNELSCNDIRPGVPRMLIVRAILAARRLGEAMDACLLPQRASNYNNVIGDAHGEIFCMEGSATDCEPIYIVGDILAHANHYVSPPMRRFEAKRQDVSGSIVRHHRAMRLLRENYGQLTPELFQKLLADHANYPASICKHAGESMAGESVTVFSMIVNLNELRAWIGRGRPCQTTYYEYSLDPWIPPQDWPT
jgi:isopenicillin-N N-acyltransferase-like protein